MKKDRFSSPFFVSVPKQFIYSSLIFNEDLKKTIIFVPKICIMLHFFGIEDDRRKKKIS